MMPRNAIILAALYLTLAGCAPQGWEAGPSSNFDFTSDDTAIVIGAGFGKSF